MSVGSQGWTITAAVQLVCRVWRALPLMILMHQPYRSCYIVSQILSILRTDVQCFPPKGRSQGPYKSCTSLKAAHKLWLLPSLGLSPAAPTSVHFLEHYSRTPAPGRTLAGCLPRGGLSLDEISMN